jgi:hypothetical protein
MFLSAECREQHAPSAVAQPKMIPQGLPHLGSEADFRLLAHCLGVRSAFNRRFLRRSFLCSRCSCSHCRLFSGFLCGMCPFLVELKAKLRIAPYARIPACIRLRVVRRTGLPARIL